MPKKRVARSDYMPPTGVRPRYRNENEVPGGQSISPRFSAPSPSSQDVSHHLEPSSRLYRLFFRRRRFQRRLTVRLHRPMVQYITLCFLMMFKFRVILVFYPL